MGTIGPGLPTAQPRSGLSTFQHQQERLYRTGPGNYVAVEDIEPLQPGDLPLWKGMHVEGIPRTHRGMAVIRIQKQSEETNIHVCNGETIQPSNHIGDGTTQGAFKNNFSLIDTDQSLAYWALVLSVQDSIVY